MGRIKLLWGIIFVLILLQVLTVFYFISEGKNEAGADSRLEYAAKVGEEYITMEDLNQRLRSNYGENVLEELINRKLIFTEAKRLQFTISEEEIEQEINLLRQDYASEEEFYQTLHEQIGISQEDLRNEIRFYLLMEDMATKDIVIEEQEQRQYYEDNIDQYYVPTRLHLHTILVPTEEEAERVIQEIEQGSSFEAVAAERSTDLVTAPAGGDMGMVSVDDFFLDQAVARTAEKLTLNQLSTPIQTEEGYTVIKVSERVEGKIQPFEDVKSKIRRELAVKQIDGVTSFLESLRARVGVENYLYP